MATSLSWTLFDTALFGVAVGMRTLFQIAEGGDDAHTKAYTNMRGAGSLPTEESLLVQNIGVMLDHNSLVADREGVFLHSYLELRVSDETKLLAPLRLFATHSGSAGVYTQAAAADEEMIGPLGDGYELGNPILIPAGNSFKVEIYQGTVMGAADQWVKILLNGILTRT